MSLCGNNTIAMRFLSILLSLGLVIQWKNANGFHVSSLLPLASTSPSPSALYSTAWKNPFESLFSGGSDQKVASRSNKQQQQEEDEMRQRLIDELLEKCNTSPRYSKQKRTSIEETMDLLAPLSPIQQTAASPMLQKEWKLVWTSEKEINFFYDWNFSDDIRQTINGTLLQNMIRFKTTTNNDPHQQQQQQQPVGFFGVQGRLSIPNVTGVRTDFVFESATLNLGRWGEYKIPPIGNGYFDTIYLDDALRIDTNSRNDILICTAD